VTNYVSHVMAYPIVLPELAVLHLFQVSWGNSVCGQ
jgi:quinol-cytochrome oxidoreductase complex cytochrome b subunit